MAKPKSPTNTENAIVIQKGEAALVAEGEDLHLYIPKKGGSKKVARYLAAVGVLWETDQEFVDNVLQFYEDKTQ